MSIVFVHILTNIFMKSAKINVGFVLYYSDFSLVQDFQQINFYSVQHESFPIIQRNDVLMLFIQIGYWYAKQPTYRN